MFDRELRIEDFVSDLRVGLRAWDAACICSNELVSHVEFAIETYRKEVPNMRKNDPITNLMVTDVVTIQKGEPVSRAKQLLAEGEFHHLPVLDGDKLVGMVSSIDIMRLSFEAYNTDERTMDVVLDKTFILEEVMETDLVTISHKDTVRRAVNLLSEGKFHSLPVVGEDEGLKGIVTSTDLIRYLMKQY